MIHRSRRRCLGCRGVIFSSKQEVPLPPHHRILTGNRCRQRPDGELSARSGRILLISWFYVTHDVWRDISLEMNPGVPLSSVFVQDVISLIESTRVDGVAQGKRLHLDVDRRSSTYASSCQIVVPARASWRTRSTWGQRSHGPFLPCVNMVSISTQHSFVLVSLFGVCWKTLFLSLSASLRCQMQFSNFEACQIPLFSSH